MDASLVKQRDSANDSVKQLSKKNKDVIGEFRQAVAAAKEKRTKRNELNAQIKELKVARDSKRDGLEAARKPVEELKAELKSGSYSEDPVRLQEEIDRLEWIQQTEPLSPKQEKELGKQITEMRKRLESLSAARVLIAKFDAARKTLRALEKEFNELNSKIFALARESQENHKASIDASKKADFFSKQISEGLNELGEKRKAADEIHAQVVASREQVQAEQHKQRVVFDREKAEEDKFKSRETEKQKKKISEKAQVVLTKFKAGEKITTQELLLLQESGLF